jgi:hypothetical protein
MAATLGVRPSALLIAQRLFNASQILAQSRKDQLAFFAVRHLGSEELEDKWIGGLPNSLYRCFSGLFLQLTQAAPNHKCFCVLA